MIKLARKVISYLETADIPFSYFILTFFAAATLRNLLEQLVFADSDNVHLAGDLLHYYLSYICLALGFIILLRLATKEDVAKVSRVVLPCFMVLNIVPIIDQWVFMRGAEYGLGYMFPGQHDPLLPRLLTFFGSVGESGFTYGMRIEIAIVLAACSVYFSIKGLGRGKNILFCLLTYIFIFACGALPYGIKWFLSFFILPPVKYSAQLFIHSYLLLIFILTGIVAFLYRPKYIRALFKDIRLPRVLHYELMFFIGIYVAKHMNYGSVVWDQQRPFEVIFSVIAIFMACLFALTTNNLADIRIDKVSNNQRPTVSGAIPLADYRFISWLSLAVMVIYAGSVGIPTLFILVTFTSIYFIYSMPPLRFKRIPFFSKGLIVVNSILLLSLGFYLQGQGAKLVSDPARFFFAS